MSITTTRRAVQEIPDDKAFPTRAEHRMGEHDPEAAQIFGGDARTEPGNVVFQVRAALMYCLSSSRSSHLTRRSRKLPTRFST
jgi:hypothetical protein